MSRFKNKVALVTGGNSGIGRAAALEFIREGARVALLARGVERGEEVIEEIKSRGGEAIFIPTDVAKSSEVEAAVQRTVQEFGRLDFAFNNAASYEGAYSLTADFSEDEFDRTVAVNLKGVWLCMKYEILQMLDQDPPGGAIVNTSSINGLGGTAQASIYSATKAGILGLSKSAAIEYADSGIRVNVLVAGAFDTPMRRYGLEQLSGGDPDKIAKIQERFLQFVPLSRVGHPREAAKVVTWLCSDEASYVTGHSMIVDGGLSALAR